MSPRQPLLRIEGLTKRFPGTLAVAGADLDLWPGEVVALLGKNGAGKSTLIKVLAGVETADEGEIRIDGRVVSFSSPQEARRLGVAVVHQELCDVPGLTVGENLLLGLGYPRRIGPFVSRAALARRASDVLSRLGARIDPRAPMGSLSGVDRRLVTIARALAQDARVVVLDEPSASLTDEEIARLHEVVGRLRADGVCVVYVSHRLDEVLRLADRVVVMRAGRVVAVADRAGLTRDELVVHITGSGDDEARHPVSAPAVAVPRPPGAALLRTEGLSRRGVVEDVTMDVHAGEILGIAGLAGSGRTELLRLLFGADQATAGRVLMRGEEVRLRSPAEAMRAGIALLPEDRRHEGNIAAFRIRENVTLAALDRHRALGRIAAPSRRRERVTAREYVRTLGIAAVDEEQPVRWLSGGNQQKVVLAKWLAFGARVLLFDEPTQGIDVAGKRDVFEQVERLAAEGNAVVYVSSDLSEVVALCRRVVVMSAGRLVAELEGARITESALLRHCYADAHDVPAPPTSRSRARPSPDPVQGES